jgi:hypothetical protein
MCVDASLHRCVILNNDKVKCWGMNRAGQLGLGHTRNIGSKPGEMGENLPYVDLGTVRNCVHSAIFLNFQNTIVNIFDLRDLPDYCQCQDSSNGVLVS